ncbi:MAG: hypothetical protein H0T83_00790 [Chthoniobacterales bacterium]|nr:hypothetical protein [Chthoniobacterales bacterium]
MFITTGALLADLPEQQATLDPVLLEVDPKDRQTNKQLEEIMKGNAPDQDLREEVSMSDPAGTWTKRAARRKGGGHRPHFRLGVIMVPALGPRRQSSQDSALERQLELLRRAVSRQAEIDKSE